MAKASPAATDGFIVETSRGSYEIVWQGDGNFVVYSGREASKKLTIVANHGLGKSDESYHELSATILPSAAGNRIAASLDRQRVIDVTDRHILLTGNEIRVTALVNGFLKDASVERE